jgi:hypothetical protein
MYAYHFIKIGIEVVHSPSFQALRNPDLEHSKFLPPMLASHPFDFLLESELVLKFFLFADLFGEPKYHQTKRVEFPTISNIFLEW